MVAEHLINWFFKGFSLQQVSVEVIQGEAVEDETRVNFFIPFFILAIRLLDAVPFLGFFKIPILSEIFYEFRCSLFSKNEGQIGQKLPFK